MTDPPRTIGRYELVSLLGRGGHGEVWRALRRGPHGFTTEVAVKWINHRALGDMLVREARYGALLRHPNVVAVHDIEEIDGNWLMVMDLVDGWTVSEPMRAGVRFSPRAVMELGHQTLEGLVHIHELQVDGEHVGLLHRDIKPGNLMVDATGTVKIADLGIADLVGSSKVSGTPGYVAPEQLHGDADPRSDLFSLAIVLVRALGAPSLLGGGKAAILKTTQLTPEEVAEWVEPVDELLPGGTAVLGRWLQPDPAKRPASCREAIAEWTALYAHHPQGVSLPKMRPEQVSPDVRPTQTTSATVATPWAAPARAPLVGRQEVLEQIDERWHEGVLALVGPGGMGKTRVAEAAAERRSEPGHWVDLSSATSTQGVRGALASTLALHALVDPRDLARSADTTLPETSWLVLDNLEQLDDEAMDWLHHFVTALGRPTLLTSRVVPTWIEPDRVVRLAPLEPADAAELYRQRYPVAAPRDAEGIDLIVRALEGVPLAIELAARARLPHAPEGRRPERHRSVEACVDISLDLLGPELRRVLAALTVFEGRYDAAAALAVARPKLGVETALSQLVDASLVDALPDGRFRLLDLVRRHVRRRATPPELERAAQRHADWFAQLSTSPKPAHLADLITACRRATRTGRRDVAVRCALGAWKLLEAQGPIELGATLLEPLHDLYDGRDQCSLTVALAEAMALGGRLPDALDLLETELASLDARAPERPRILHQLGTRLFELGRMEEAAEALVEGVDGAERRGDQISLAECEGMLGLALQRLGRLTDSIPHFERAIALNEVLERPVRKGAVLGNLGAVYFEQGDSERARPLFEEAVRIHRRHHHPRLEAVALISLGTLAARQGDLSSSVRRLTRCLILARRVGNTRLEAYAQLNLADALHALDDPRTQQGYEDTVAIAVRSGDPRAEAHARRCYGQWALGHHRPDEARSQLQASERLARELSDGLHPITLALLARLEVSSGDLPAATTYLEAAEGSLADDVPRDVVVHVLCARAVVRAHHGRRRDAEEDLLAASEMVRAIGCAPRSPLGQTVDRARRAANL